MGSLDQVEKIYGSLEKDLIALISGGGSNPLELAEVIPQYKPALATPKNVIAPAGQSLMKKEVTKEKKHGMI